MLSNVTNNYYPEGYGFDEISCTDLTIAHALGTYVKDYYYYYCFLCSLYRNLYKFPQGYSQKKKSEDILEILGFQLIDGENSNNVLDFVEESLKKKEPVILYTNYQCLFFTIGYKKKNQNNHSFLITSYDKDKGIVSIQDAQFIERYDVKFTKGEIYYKGRLKTETFLEIVEETRDFFNLSKESFKKEKIFKLSPINGSFKCISQDDLSKEFIKLKNERLKIFGIRNHFKNLSNDSEIYSFFYYARRDYLGGFRIILDFLSNRLNGKNLIFYNKLSQEFLNNLDVYLSLSFKELLKSKTVNNKKLDQLEIMINHSKNLLMEFILKNV